jgi:hypothetical protein
MPSSLNGTGVTFSDSTTQASGQQAAKAWVNFNGSTGTRNSSYNVSSVTKTAQGTYTIAFTNALADANYAFVGMSTLNIFTRLQVVAQNYSIANTASNCYVVAGYAGGATDVGFPSDVDVACVAFYR